MDSISTQTGTRQARGANGGGPVAGLRKPAIALVLAGGPPHPGFGPEAPAFRPLLPFRGRPIVEHVLGALDASCVRRTLVFHDPACDLAGTVEGGGKATFVPLPHPSTPIGESVRYAFQACVRACGIDVVRGSRLLILPCDQPFTTPAAIDGVLERADGRDFDFAYLAVSRGLLSRRYPGRPFRAFHVADLGGWYALQTATILDGRFLGPGRGSDGLSFGDWTPEEAAGLFASISLLREGRERFWQVPQFVAELGVRRLSRNGGRRLMAVALARTLAGRLRTTDVDRLTAAAFRLRTVCIDSEAPELSADIDAPEDVDFYLGLEASR